MAKKHITFFIYLPFIKNDLARFLVTGTNLGPCDKFGEKIKFLTIQVLINFYFNFLPSSFFFKIPMFSYLTHNYKAIFFQVQISIICYYKHQQKNHSKPQNIGQYFIKIQFIINIRSSYLVISMSIEENK